MWMLGKYAEIGAWMHGLYGKRPYVDAWNICRDQGVGAWKYAEIGAWMRGLFVKRSYVDALIFAEIGAWMHGIFDRRPYVDAWKICRDRSMDAWIIW